jgi:hypothetical protein
MTMEDPEGNRFSSVDKSPARCLNDRESSTGLTRDVSPITRELCAKTSEREDVLAHV